MADVIKLKLEALTPSIPGQAKLMINRWEGAEENLQFTIQRNQDHFFLDDVGEWRAGSVSHLVNQLIADGDSYYIDIKANILDSLLNLSGVSFRLTLKDSDGEKSEGTILMGANLLSSDAAGKTPESAVVIAPPEVIVNEPAPEPELQSEVIEETSNIDPEPAPPARPQPQKKSKIPVIAMIIGIVVLIVAILVAYFLLLKPKDEPTEPPAAQTEPAPVAEPEPEAEPVPEPEPVPVPEPAPEAEPIELPVASISAPCSIETAKAAVNEMDFVKACLKSSPSSNDLVQIIQDAKANNLCTVAQRIYAYKSQSGDKVITLAYAKEFDPETNVKGGCFNADAETAVYWYEALLNNDPDNSDAKTRLESLKK